MKTLLQIANAENLDIGTARTMVIDYQRHLSHKKVNKIIGLKSA